MAKGKNDYIDYPVAFFCELEHARKKDDYGRAAWAYANLIRLGVTVKYKSRVTNKKIATALQALAGRASRKSPQTIIRVERQ
ncbi:MAG: hypothetical protein ABIL62_05150 [Planctomycetota bacterium]